MKEKIILIEIIGILCFGLIGCSNGAIDTKSSTEITSETQNNKDIDFRNVTWGMTPDEVKKAEKDVNFTIENEELGIFSGKTEINSKDAMINYIFSENELNACVIKILETHSNENLYIDDYDSFKSLFIKKYGEPSLDKQIWHDDLYKDTPNDWGFAISLGDLEYVTNWTTNTTQLGLMLSGDNYEIQMNILYTPIDYESESDTSGI